MIWRMQIALVALGTCAAASCADSGASGYPVAAEAELSGGGISGPLELLGTPSTAATDDFHTLAAYRIRLPDDALRRVQILALPDCDAPYDPTQRLPIADLGVIRRVAGESHFFAIGIHAGDRTIALDTGTARGLASIGDYPESDVIGAIAVILSYDVGTGSTGAREACGVFALTDP